MKQICFAALTALLFSCSSATVETLNTPDPPGSLDQVRQQLKQGRYSVEKVGFISPIVLDKTNMVTWEDRMEDTTKFYREFLDERKKFTLQFTSDSTVNVNTGKENFTAQFDLDTLRDENEEGNSMKLRLRYPDPDFQMPGSTEPTLITYTYKVRGLNDRQLMLESPHAFNRQTAYLLMDKK